MIKKMNYDREPRRHAGHSCQAVIKACEYLRRIVAAEAQNLLDGVEKLAKGRFLEWFKNTWALLGLNRQARLTVLAIVG